MDETTRLELKSLSSATGSRISGNASILHSAGVGESLRQSSPSWLRRVGLAVLLLLIPIAYAGKLHESEKHRSSPGNSSPCHDGFLTRKETEFIRRYSTRGSQRRFHSMANFIRCRPWTITEVHRALPC